MHDRFQEKREQGVYHDISISVKLLIEERRKAYIHLLETPLANNPSFTHCRQKGGDVILLQCRSSAYGASLGAEASWA